MRFQSYCRIIILFTAIYLSNHAFAQNADAFFQIPGRIKLEKGDPAGTVVSLTNLENNNVEKRITVNNSGRFDLQLNYQTDYRIDFAKEGYYDKIIDVSTIIPRGVWEKDSVFPPYLVVVTLYPVVPDTKMSFEGKVIGKIVYSPDGVLDNFDARIYIDDKVIKNEIDLALKQLGDGDFDKKLAEAMDLEQKLQLQDAYRAYSEASKIKPDDKFVKEKLKELALDMKDLQNEAKKQAEYERQIALGDQNVGAKKYPQGLINYRQALNIKPNDQVATDKIASTEALIARLEADKAKLEADYTRLLASGDANVAATKYPEAINDFKGALTLKPNDATATQKLANAEQLLAQYMAEQERIEKEKRLLADKQNRYRLEVEKADQQFDIKKYTEAKTSYQSALNIDESATYPKERIALIDKLVAEAEAARRLASATSGYEQNIKLGDENFDKSQWSVARFYYSQALNVKTDDSYALQRVQECDKRTNANITAEKLNEFNSRVKKGDEAFDNKNYSSARFYYRSALEIISWDEYPLKKLKEVDDMFAQNLSAAEQKLFAENVQKADEAFEKKEYPVARFYYNKANEINPDQYVGDKLKEIENIVSGRESTRIDSEYKDFIKKADEAFAQKNYSIARYYYQQALTLKPGEKYPADQLNQIKSVQ